SLLDDESTFPLAVEILPKHQTISRKIAERGNCPSKK
ncbi:unnamed protein product, partial [marine sediment metagenome]